ncbi:MAG: cell division protein FtsZ [Clostridia bacterium]|nr:cell division protein FtsZ [Clostridia bacterium]
MSFESEQDSAFSSHVRIKVIGVGGGGGNAVNRMISTDIRGVEFVTVNTDSQALHTSSASQKILIGENGFGAGSDPAKGRAAAESSEEAIREVLKDTDMVFITSGMGGGTGTGAAPVIAKLAREMNILTVGIVTKPFSFEGKRRMAQAEEGIRNLKEYVDALIVIPNERLKQVSDTHITMINAFEIADDVLRLGVQSVSELINVPGFINLDFADVTAVMKDAGFSHMGVGAVKGEDKARRAALQAISSPLLETSIAGATGILISIVASSDVALDEVDIAASLVSEEAHPDAKIIFGAAFDPQLQDEMRVTVIATGFDNAKKNPTDPDKDPLKTIPAPPSIPSIPLGLDEPGSSDADSDAEIDMTEIIKILDRSKDFGKQ